MAAPIRNVKVQNFRGIREADLELDPRVTVLFGSNAAGKTTFLDALAIGLGAIPSRLPNTTGRAFAKRGDLRVVHNAPPLLQYDLAAPRESIECPFARVSLQSVDGIRWDVTKRRSRADSPVVPKGIGLKELHAWLDPIVRADLDGEERAPIPLVAAYGNERAVVDVPLRERGFNREFDPFGAFDRSLEATTRFKTVFEWFRVMEDLERRDREQRRDFDYVLPALEWVRRALAAAELRCSNPRVETGPIRMLVDFEHDDGSREPLDIRSLSDGYRTHFALVVDLARRMVQLNPSLDLDDPSRGTKSPAVVLIDEVDLHLDPQWQARVVRGLLGAFPNAQFLLTTHSEQVVGSLDASQVRRLSWASGEIVIERVPFAQGASSERILVNLMGAAERVPGPVTNKLNQYLALVSSNQGSTQRARELRACLDEKMPHDPALHRADLYLRSRQLIANLREDDT